jgi:hypothetical protein
MEKMGGLEMGRPFFVAAFLLPRSRHPELVSG